MQNEQVSVEVVEEVAKAAKAANEYDERNGNVALVDVYEEHGDEVDDNEKCHYGQKNSNHVIGKENVDCGEEEEKEEQERKAALALEDVVELGHVVCESASVRCRMFAQDVQAGVAVGGACWTGRRRGSAGGLWSVGVPSLTKCVAFISLSRVPALATLPPAIAYLVLNNLARGARCVSGVCRNARGALETR